ncbi:MAG TPA: hypothetical protein VGG14_03310 [Candidatus Sulfotelmatobacter sp.]
MGNESEESTKRLLNNDNEQTYSPPSLRPLHDRLRAHSWDTMKQMPVLLKDGPKFHRDGQGDSDVGDVRQNGL